MGVWDLKGLHQEITKWEKLAQSQNVSESDRLYYLSKAEAARVAYARECTEFEDRSTKFEEVTEADASS